MGQPDTNGIPIRHGFDFWFGYLDQGEAHNYYPTHLWRCSGDDVGRLLTLLTELDIDERTLVLFTSDNGPHSEGGHQ